MISNLDPASELFLSNVNRIQQRLADANRQIASGKKISQASDAPDEIDTILQLRADQQRNQQVKSNLALAATDAQSADDTINSAIKLMDRARVLGAQGANTTLDAGGRQSLAQETQSLLDEMVAFSQTAVQGRYIFSGDTDTVAAYQADSTAPTGVTQVVTAAATRRIEDPAGRVLRREQDRARDLRYTRGRRHTRRGQCLCRALQSPGGASDRPADRRRSSGRVDRLGHRPSELRAGLLWSS